jgi:hypothetical protein
MAAAAVLMLTAIAAVPTLAAPALVNTPARLPANSASLQDFIAGLPVAPAGKPAGIYVAGSLSLPIVQQPVGQPAFVSSKPGVLTQFTMAEEYGTTGLLAHNTLAGAEFSRLELGKYIALVYSDGRITYYRVQNIERYQALDPLNPYSDFRSTDGTRLDVADLFNKIYAAKPGQLVLQTCIASGGNPSWGRLFVIATPVTEQVRSALSQAAGLVNLTSLGLSNIP